MSTSSFVVTGGADGIGRAVAERLTADGEVTVLDVADLGWTHPGVRVIHGDAGDPAAAATAATEAERLGPLVGWVNNAAIFSDAGIADATAQELRDLITANLGLAITGRRWAGPRCDSRADHPEGDRQLAALHPLGRVGESAEVAEVVAFLLNSAAGFVNGVVLPIDGGRAAQGADPEAR